MRRIPHAIMSFVSWAFSVAVSMVLIAGGMVFLLFQHFNKDLPDYSQLLVYDPPTITRLYAADGRLMAEYATEKRVFVPLSAIPKRVQQAFISAEDKNFYTHDGIDFSGILRAVRDNIINYGTGKSIAGGSTITQQVVKNFLLSNEKSLERKIKEAILAYRISRVFTKDKILELYLNEIYLGLGSYGVAAAAQNYFNKSMDELSIDEVALLAAQPKAPSTYNPKKNYELAKQRRDWVIDRMFDAGYIDAEESADAKKNPITLRNRDMAEVVHADFFSEEVRRNLVSMYNESVLYEGGLVVKTTLDPTLQDYADSALRAALIDYDRRRGYRGPLEHMPFIGAKMDNWKEEIQKLAHNNAHQLFDGQRLGLVTALDKKRAVLIFDDESAGMIPMKLLGWTRRVIADGELGPAVTKPEDILSVGDVVIVGPISNEQKKLLTKSEQQKSWDLQQVPAVNGAMVVIDPHTGKVLAMSGGYAYGGTEFNRATQAKRQPGSSFKPFVYMAGLETGLTPSSLFLDAPVELSQGAGLPTWKPQNYHDSYMGPTTMRVGLEKSRNTMTVRLAQMIGIDHIIEIGNRFGIYDELPRNFSIVLGAAETTLLRLTNAYGMIVNGGKRITPSLIERIDDRHGKTIFRRDSRNCEKCTLESLNGVDPDAPPPIPLDTRERVIDARIAYQMTSMLQGVVQRGTATRAKEIGKIVGGKTGTTNNSFDTWFVGFSPDLVAGVYIGYDTPKTLGKKETGGSVALPGFINFMKMALKDQPNTPFRIPPGITLVRVDLHTGQLPFSPGNGGEPVIDEAFISGGPLFLPNGNVSMPMEAPGIPGQMDISVQPAPSQPDDTEHYPQNDDIPVVVTPPPIPGMPAPEAPPISGTGALY